jgi:hypothetical protein
MLDKQPPLSELAALCKKDLQYFLGAGACRVPRAFPYCVPFADRPPTETDKFVDRLVVLLQAETAPGTSRASDVDAAEGHAPVRAGTVPAAHTLRPSAPATDDLLTFGAQPAASTGARRARSPVRMGCVGK